MCDLSLALRSAHQDTLDCFNGHRSIESFAETFQVIVLRTFAMKAAITEPDVRRKIYLELLLLWVWPTTVHVIHVHLHLHLTVWIPEELRCAHTPREAQLVTRNDQPIVDQLGVDPAIVSAASTKCSCSCQLLASDSNTLQVVRPHHPAQEPGGEDPCSPE